MLVQARIARGWSQRELAKRLGLQMQAIQQYEAWGYEQARLARVLQVIQALGAAGRLQLKLVPIVDRAELKPSIWSDRRRA